MRICSGEILWQKTSWMSRCVHYGPYEYSSARSLRVCSLFLFYSDFFKQVDWKLLGDYGYHVHTMTLAFIHWYPSLNPLFACICSAIWISQIEYFIYMNILQRSTLQMYQPSAFISWQCTALPSAISLLAHSLFVFIFGRGRLGERAFCVTLAVLELVLTKEICLPLMG